MANNYKTRKFTDIKMDIFMKRFHLLGIMAIIHPFWVDATVINNWSQFEVSNL